MIFVNVCESWESAKKNKDLDIIKFSCELCDQTTAIETDMRQHVRNLHLKDKSSQTVKVSLAEGA
jgi:hypothetical protein